jgi:hypothetical protein
VLFGPEQSEAQQLGGDAKPGAVPFQGVAPDDLDGVES